MYRGVNRTRKVIYYGVSKDPHARVNGSHCEGNTKAVQRWDCDSDKIAWKILAKFDNQKDATTMAHELERQPPPSGYTIIRTAGI